MKKAILILAALGFIAAGCSHAVKQSPEQAAQAAAPQKAVQKAPAEKKLNPASTENVTGKTNEAKQQAAVVAAEKKIGDIHFAFDKYSLNADAKDKLHKLSDLLLKNSNAKVMIEGRCDERGTEEYNLALGDKRANAAKNYLMALGVPASQLSTVSYGKDKPLCTEHSEKCWSMNRSDHFSY
ncbi:MAG: peptidoglycan-associated lipoprotein Pal [Nitrospiraceae bacterium]|nr:peptidoglycan-associated lipoprotein Pal [Nitrospiraceae bacterium]